MKAVVLISGRGSNLSAIIKSSLPVAAVISDNKDAAGLDIARRHCIPAHIICKKDYGARFEDALDKTLGGYEPCIAVLAGFMTILKSDIVRRRKIINIHPSLLPAFAGLNTHRRALAAGAKAHGCTVHWVGEKVDGGKIIKQKKVAVQNGDDEASLAARVLAAEHDLYPRVIRELLKTESVDAESAGDLAAIK